jgi:hypothetical protein
MARECDVGGSAEQDRMIVYWLFGVPCVVGFTAAVSAAKSTFHDTCVEGSPALQRSRSGLR